MGTLEQRQDDDPPPGIVGTARTRWAPEARSADARPESQLRALQDEARRLRELLRRIEKRLRSFPPSSPGGRRAPPGS